MQYGSSKCMEKVVPHLAQRLFDDSPAVRKAVVKIVGNWLLDLPDRYSFHYKLIPLLLTGLADTQPEIAELADTLWYDTGEHDTVHSYSENNTTLGPDFKISLRIITPRAYIGDSYIKIHVCYRFLLCIVLFFFIYLNFKHHFLIHMLIVK